MNVRALFSLAVFGLLLLTGCGAGSPPQANLAGNWLLVGPMPTTELPLTPVTNVRLAMTFDVIGNNISAYGYVDWPCDVADQSGIVVSSASFGVSATGTVEDGGRFTLQTAAGDPGSLSIQGKAPQPGSGEWSGTYNMSYTLPFGVCSGSSSGLIAATAFPLINGIYDGTAQIVTAGIPKGKPITIQATLKQSGTVINPATGLSTPSDILLEGSVQVAGSSCFKSGTTGVMPLSAVEGDLVLANFTMDDGSTLELQGTLIDAVEGTIDADFVGVAGGKCAGIYQTTGFTRQAQVR
ncbi:hypothetical protein RBB77_16800 [Tunturibacter psychrotolerans]|uniref:Lipoprotein n=1 Tax=Tunturiibacter psychrotolerans TaxID=3069686 RepID=A0AAU7ZLI9_9BACT